MQKFIRVNERIKSPEVRLIGPETEQLGIHMIKRALDMAKEHGLDLVEIAPTAKPPVCRIMDYSKFKYDQEKKERRIKRNQHVVHLKQIRLNPNIGEGDYQVKMRQASTFLERKDKVKINMFFRGREMMHKDLGKQVLVRASKDLSAHGTPERITEMEGRIMSVVVNPGVVAKGGTDGNES